MSPPVSFGHAAGDFDRLAPLLWQPLAAATLERSSRGWASGWVLDACCGTGASALPTAGLVGPGGQVDAVDLSAERIAVLQRHVARLPQLRAHHGDVTSWAGENYDLVQSVMGIFFLPDMTASVRALAASPAGGPPSQSGTRVRSTPRARRWPSRSPRCSADRHQRRAPPSRRGAKHAGPLPRLADPAGLRAVRVDTVPHTIPLTADNAWLLVLGSGFRGMLEGLDAAQVDQVRHTYLDELTRRRLAHLDARPASSASARGHAEVCGQRAARAAGAAALTRPGAADGMPTVDEAGSVRARAQHSRQPSSARPGDPGPPKRRPCPQGLRRYRLDGSQFWLNQLGGSISPRR